MMSRTRSPKAQLYNMRSNFKTRKGKMSATATDQNVKPFTIMGPQMVRGHAVRNAIDALIYLPESYRLVFAGHPEDQSFYNEIVELVERYALATRVRFMYEAGKPDVVVAGDDGVINDKAVSGDTPEALASAILRAARA
jgi:hypothetical protein